MKNVNRLPAHTTSPTREGRRSPHAPVQSGRGLSGRLISDAVVASYIHDISQRHRIGVDEPEAGLRRSARRPDPDRAPSSLTA
jgi:hypothetical protein